VSIPCFFELLKSFHTQAASRLVEDEIAGRLALRVTIILLDQTGELGQAVLGVFDRNGGEIRAWA
jgi:hypothetical protein